GFPFETLDDFHDTLIAILAVHDMGGRTKLSWFAPVSQAALTRECAPILSTRLRQAAFPTRAHMDVYKYGPELLRIVRANRDIFSSFFYLEYPGQSAKARYLKKALKSGDAPQRTAAVSRHRADHDGMPLAKRSCSLRTVGGRQFVFDREGARAFRVNAVGARVFEACRTHEPHATLVSDLMSRYGETEGAIGSAIDRVLAQLGDEGLLATRVRPTTASRQCALPCRK
ncbi:MAG: PqqD family protein, partial [Gemmatimonadetes bacterium]|nr:PqqD family protein [Gemmatimonadota bacterium]